jgi:hypothetical protein
MSGKLLDANPELRRYVWLELSTFRLIAVPAVVAIVAFIIMATTTNTPWDALATFALAGYAISAGFAGASRAFGSVTEEVRDRTWDFQRMSALPPWSLAIGKILGAPIFMNYIGLCCLVVFLVAAIPAEYNNPALIAVGMISATLAANAIAVALSAAAGRSAMSVRALRGGPILFGFALLIWFLPPFVAVVIQPEENARNVTVDWWFFNDWSLQFFAVLSIIVFAAWAVFAAWRAMARELRETAWWWAWPSFAFFVWIWFGGVRADDATETTLSPLVFSAAAAIAILVFASYLQLFLEPLTQVTASRYAQLARNHAPWHRRLPHWLIHGLIALAVAFAATALFAALGHTSSVDSMGGFKNATQANVVMVIGLPLALMFIRDAAIAACFTLNPKIKSPMALAVFCVVVLNVLLPLFLNAVGLRSAALAVFPFGMLDRVGLAGPAVSLGVQAAIAVTVALVLHAANLRRAARDAP